MAICRTYLCDDCGTKFDKLHFDRNEPAPECPGCAALEARQIPAGFSIGAGKTSMSEAVKITQDVMERDLGFTNFKDNTRPGDIVAPSLPTHLQQQAASFYKPSGDIIAAAKAGAKLANAEGTNPLSLGQRVLKKRGPGPAVRVNPVNSRH